MKKARRSSLLIFNAVAFGLMASFASATYAHADDLDTAIDFAKTGVKFVASCGVGADVAFDEIAAQFVPAASWIRQLPIDGEPGFLANDEFGMSGKTRAEKYADHSMAALGSLLGPVAEGGLDAVSYVDAWIADGADYLKHGKLTEDHPHARLFSATKASYKYMVKTINDYVLSDSSACQQARQHLVVILSAMMQSLDAPIVAQAGNATKSDDIIYVSPVSDAPGVSVTTRSHSAQ